MNNDKQSDNSGIDAFLRKVSSDQQVEQFQASVRQMSEILYYHYEQCRKSGFNRLESLALTRDYYAYCLNQTRGQQ